jgi:hypothetical protein
LQAELKPRLALVFKYKVLGKSFFKSLPIIALSSLSTTIILKLVPSVEAKIDFKQAQSLSLEW